MDNIAALILVAVVMLGVLGGVSLLAHMYTLNIKSKTVGNGQHGTARWATKSEIRKTYKHIPFEPEQWQQSAPSGKQVYGSVQRASERAGLQGPL